jgi:hypothetical protein
MKPFARWALGFFIVEFTQHKKGCNALGGCGILLKPLLERYEIKAARPDKIVP